MSSSRPTPQGYVESEGVRIHYEVQRRRSADDPAAADVDHRPQAALEGAGALPLATLPRRVLRRARQRLLRPATGPRGIPPRRPGPARPGGARRHRHRPRRGRRPLPGCRLGSAAGRRSTATACSGAVFIGPSLAITDGHPARVAAGRPGGPAALAGAAHRARPVEHWAKYDPAYWREHHEDFLWFFFGMCFPEPHSTKQIEDCVGWGLDTTPDVLAAEAEAARPTRETIEDVVPHRRESRARDPRRPRPDQPPVTRANGSRS